MKTKRFSISIIFACIIISSSFSQNLQNIESKDYKKCILNESNQSIKYIELTNKPVIDEQFSVAWLKAIHKSGQDNNFELYETQTDDLDFTHLRYNQYYKGLPVEFGRYYLHVKNNHLQSANGDYYPNIDLSSTPQITKGEALQFAIEHVQAVNYIWESTNENPLENASPKLVILPFNKSYQLAYKLDIYATNPLSRQDVFINALSGEHILSVSQIHFSNANGLAETRYSGNIHITTDSLSPTSFRLRETGRGNGILTKDLNKGLDYTQAVDFTDTDNYWNDTTNHNDVATDVHYGMETTYDYFYTKHNRSSYDQAGTAIQNFIHAGSWLSLAFWDGIGFYFGDGDGINTKPFGSLDIVAHEFTHAVIEYSASLTYLYEAGALQESFADIFAVCVDYYKNSSYGNFMIGEQITTSGLPMRNMASPKTKNQPDTYQGQYWNTSIGNEWVNSGVQNFWFFLLATGLNGVNDNNDTFSITGIGINDAAKIAYRSLTTYLTPLADFNDARFASIQSAIDLFGSCSPKVQTTTDAWWAVGVGNKYQNDSLESKFSAAFRYLCNTPSETFFINNSTNASNYLWDFGDSTFSSLPNPLHTYQDTGYFTVSLSVWDTSSVCGTNDTDITIKTNYIYVKPNAVVNFESDLTEVNAGCEIITFNDLSDSCVQERKWEISPPYYSIKSVNNDLPEIKIRFDSAGTYHVKLIVDFGLTKDSILKSNYITVHKPSNPDFVANLLNPRIDLDTVLLSDLNPVCSWQRTWTISPNSYTLISKNADNSQIKVVFNTATTYNIKLTVGYGAHSSQENKLSYINALDYCIPTVSNINQDIGISFFKFQDITNFSTIGQYKYNDYTNLSTSIAQFDTVAITLGRNTTHNVMSRKVWIDYNMDGDFNDVGEMVASETPASTLYWSDTFYVPGTTKIGNTILRVGTSLMNLGNYPCGPNTYGEFEDYRLFITEMLPLIIKLKSHDSLLIEQCENYIDSGFHIYREFNPIVKIDTITNLNTALTGQYYYTYRFTDSTGFVLDVTRTLFVVPLLDITKEFFLTGNAIDSIEVFNTYTDPGYLTNQNCTIIKSVTTAGSVNTSIVGSYSLYHFLESYIGQKDTVIREVRVVDLTPPSISLNGYVDTSIMVYSIWNDPGASVSDNYYSGLNPVIVGKVETDTIGDYTLYYSSTDPSGNFSGILTRLVHVIDNESPVIKSSLYQNGDTVYIDVFASFYSPALTVKDNYFTGINKNLLGSYIAAFGENGVADITGCYTWIYEATDNSSNKAVFQLVICVEDNESPVIVLHGNSIENLASPKELLADSFSVTDNYDQNITVIRSGDYFTDYLLNHNLGFYSIYYNAEDQAGNKAVQQTRYINVDKFSSLKEYNPENSILLYPNPNTGEFFIRFDNQINAKIEIKIVSVLGTEVYSNSFNMDGRNDVKIELVDISNGLYFVHIINGAMEHTCKINIEK